MENKELDRILGLTPMAPDLLMEEIKSADIPAIPDITLKRGTTDKVDLYATHFDDYVGDWILFFKKRGWELTICYNSRFGEDWSWLGPAEETQGKLTQKEYNTYIDRGNEDLIDQVYDQLNVDGLIICTLGSRLDVLGSKNVVISTDS